ncbi:MAG: twin-arginine translocation signal domain-containing protein, partial [Acidiferrobacterales bacterium]
MRRPRRGRDHIKPRAPACQPHSQTLHFQETPVTTLTRRTFLKGSCAGGALALTAA